MQKKKSDNKFKMAMRISDMTVETAAALAGVSRPTICDRRDDPLQFRLNELQQIYGGMNKTGQNMLLEAINDVFLASQSS